MHNTLIVDSWIFWLSLAIFAGIIETLTVNMVSIWFAIGAFVACVVSLFVPDIALQIVIFAVISLALLITYFLYAKKHCRQKPRYTATNADRIIGKTGIVVEAIDNLRGVGEIKIEGNFWRANSKDNSPIPLDTKVVVVSIKGVRAIVMPAAKAKTEK